jgi:hypothetical protein
MGYICSSTFFKTSSGKELREYIKDKSQLNTLIDFGDVKVFEGVTTYPAVLILEALAPAQDHKIEILQLETHIEEDIGQHFKLYAQTMPQSWLGQGHWNIQSEEIFNLKRKIEADRKSLKEAYGTPLRGVTTGNNDVFVIDDLTAKRLILADSNNAKIIKPTIEGEDLKRWNAQPSEQYLIFTKRSIEIEKYPSIHDYLKQFREKLEPKPENWPPSKKWNGRKSGIYKWYEIQDSVAYYQNFEKPKIMWPEISQGPKFSYQTKNYYSKNTTYILPTDDKFLLGLLNSSTYWFYLKQICTNLRGGVWRLRLLRQFMEKLPIPEAKIDQKKIISELAENAQNAAEGRYHIQEKVRSRMLDLAPKNWDGKLNTKLKEWWTLDFKDFRSEVKKVFKQDIPLAERDDWEAYLNAKKQEVDKLSAELKATEDHLNAEVYKLFDLNDDEIRLIETNS